MSMSLEPERGMRLETKASRKGHALPWVSAKTRHRIEQLVSALDPVERAIAAMKDSPASGFIETVYRQVEASPVGATPQFEVAREVIAFHRHVEWLQAAGEQGVLAFLRDVDTGAALPTPVVVELAEADVSDLAFAAAHSLALETLEASGVPHARADATVFREAFVDRMSEFETVRDPPFSSMSDFGTIGQPPAGAVANLDTIVHTNRGGDPVFYCRGFFLSTATNFGTSTPARGALPPGRYSFGIVDGGRQRYDTGVWSCPNPNVTLGLP